jgi:hypothetical protein
LFLSVLDARYYEPNSGRFLSADPLGQAASPSLYDFCGGDPVNFFDPSGRCPQSQTQNNWGQNFQNPNPVDPNRVANSSWLQNAIDSFFGPGSSLPRYLMGTPFGTVVNSLDNSCQSYANGDNVNGTLYGLVAAGSVAGTVLLVEPGGAGESDLVNLASEERTAHILTGDESGGGHMLPGLPGKTAFPEDWSGPQIMNAVSDVATDPASQSIVQSNGRILITGTSNGVQINVVLEPASKGGGIVTAFPTK